MVNVGFWLLSSQLICNNHRNLLELIYYNKVLNPKKRSYHCWSLYNSISSILTVKIPIKNSWRCFSPRRCRTWRQRRTWRGADRGLRWGVGGCSPNRSPAGSPDRPHAVQLFWNWNILSNIDFLLCWQVCLLDSGIISQNLIVFTVGNHKCRVMYFVGIKERILYKFT
jgi:hypothetical protein